MNSISTQFSIKDLENLSGIKAHTIRIWEKRYHVLKPHRTDSNIRYYDIKNLQKLLNVTMLYQNGHKISHIASLPDKQLQELVREQISRNSEKEHFLGPLKIAMLNFDGSLFEYTYNKLVAEDSFRNVFLDVFVPLLQNIGLQWQSDTITPAHEHFISNLIKQKLHINIERVQQNLASTTKNTYVLFLPLNEIHELGLLYIHYELVLKGYHSIYLGQSVPIDNLKALQKTYDKIIFISYFTVQPATEDVNTYIDEISEKILKGTSDNLWILGRNSSAFTPNNQPDNIILFKNVREVINKL